MALKSLCPSILNALGIGISMLVGAVLGAPLFIGVSHGPEESVVQLIKGVVVGTVLGGVLYKLAVHRFSRSWQPQK